MQAAPLLSCTRVTANPAEGYVPFLLLWYRWQVTGEPAQVRVERSEAVSVLRELRPAQFLLPFTCHCPSAGLSPHPDVRCCHLSCIA